MSLLPKVHFEHNRLVALYTLQSERATRKSQVKTQGQAKKETSQAETQTAIAFGRKIDVARSLLDFALILENTSHGIQNRWKPQAS